MQQQKRKKSLAGFIITLLIILILSLGLLTAYLWLDNSDAFAPAAEPPFVVQDEIRALTLAPTGGVTEDDLLAYYKQAVQFAQDNNINTLVYEGKSDLTVYWRDKIFPAPDAITAQDAFRHKIDPLALLLQAAEGSGVQVWLGVDPYSATGYTEEMSGKIAKLVAQRGGLYSPVFLADDADYTALLVESLAALPRKYSIAGVMFTGLENTGGQTEGDAFNASFTALVQQLRAAWDSKGYIAGISLYFDGEGGSLLSTQAAGTLVAGGAAEYLLPKFSAGKNLAQRMEAWQAGGAKIITVTPDENSDVVLFTAAISPGYSGVLFGSYAAAAAQPGQIEFLVAMLDAEEETPPPAGFDIPQTFAVTHPADTVSDGYDGGVLVEYTTIYVMGTSNPAYPLLLDGAEVGGKLADGGSYGARGVNGAFGVLVNLELGDNVLTFTNGEETFTKTIHRKAYSPGGNGSSGGGNGGTPSTPVRAQPGQAVRLNNTGDHFASAVFDSGDINETLYNGAVFVVQEYINTGYYRMTSGDLVYADFCEIIAGDGRSAFSGLAAEPHERGEYINFIGTGTPAAYVAYLEETRQLTVTMYDTTFALPEGFASQYVRAAAVSQAEDGAVVLTLDLNEIWGYSLEYTAEGGTRLFFKRPAVRSADAAKPLTGITVMLDPGHGGNDIGTPGLMWDTGPWEKDVNLALANIIAYRLRQMGAEVLMTRTEDVRVSIGERVDAQREQKPDFFLSVHHNSGNISTDLSNVSGLHVFYFHPYSVTPSAQYAQNLITSISSATGRTGDTATWSTYKVTRVTICPSVLFEYGFMISPLDFEDVTSAEGMYASALATADAILKTLPEPAATAQPGGDTTQDPASTPPVASEPPMAAPIPLRRRAALLGF